MLWIGPGNFTFNGQEIKPGKALPSGVPADTVKSLVSKGKAGEKMPTGPVAVPGIEERFVAAREELAATQAELQTAREELVAANETIAQLTEQLTAPKGGKK